MAQEQQAIELVEKADKKTKSWISFGGNKWEDAVEMYEKAANLFKVAKKWEEAANAHLKAATCHLKLESKYDAASAYSDAASCYRKANHGDCVMCLEHAVALFTEMGKFSTAAKGVREVAEYYEAQGDLDKAVEYYRQAADLFSTDNSASNTSQCLLKIATFSAQMERYSEAVELFEKIGTDSLDNNLLRFKAKDYFFQAMLCRLAAIDNLDEDLPKAREALERYLDLDVNFGGTREATLLNELIDAMDKGDIAAFTGALRQYDSISRLDNWKSSLLLRAKQRLESAMDSLDDLQ